MPLFDNIVDEDALRDRLVRPILQQVAEQTIPAFQKALDESIDRAVLELGNIIRGAIQGIQAVEDKAIHDVAELLAAQDGWTVDVSIPQIVIPAIPISIRLTKKKEESK